MMSGSRETASISLDRVAGYLTMTVAFIDE
jgi:hypothetical protein